jgi:hypothetical protein
MLKHNVLRGWDVTADLGVVSRSAGDGVRADRGDGPGVFGDQLLS